MILVIDRQTKKLKEANRHIVLILPFCHTTLTLEQLLETYPHLSAIEELVLNDYYNLEWRDGCISNVHFHNKEDEMEFADILGEDLFTINVGTTQEVEKERLSKIELARIKELKKERKMEKRMRRQMISV